MIALGSNTFKLVNRSNTNIKPDSKNEKKENTKTKTDINKAISIKNVDNPDIYSNPFNLNNNLKINYSRT